MTNREAQKINQLKFLALTEYNQMLIRIQGIPREDLIIAISHCDNIDALRKLIEIYKSRNL